MRAVVFDTETQGLPLWREPSDHPGQPHLVQLAMIVLGDDHAVTGETSMIVRPDGWTISPELVAIHGITTERAMDEGIPLGDVLEEFRSAVARAGKIIAHSINFDARIMRIAQVRHALRGAEQPAEFDPDTVDVLRARKDDFFCTLRQSMPSMGLKTIKGANLSACVRHFFGEDLDGAHDALVDARAAARIYRHLMTLAAQREP